MDQSTSGQPKNNQEQLPGQSITDYLDLTRSTLLKTQEQIQRAADVLTLGQKLLFSTPPPDLTSYSATKSPDSESSQLTDQPRSLIDEAAVRIHTLGVFRVCIGEREIEHWNSGKAKGIMKLLVSNMGRPLPKDFFLETLWSEQSARQANSSFRVALHQLRQTLGSTVDSRDPLPLVRVEGNNYFLSLDNPTLPVWIDVAEFEHQWRLGRERERAGQSSESVSHFLHAEKLYAGDFLEEDIYEDWSVIIRESLVDTYLSLLGKLTAYHLDIGDHETCIEFCQKILRRDRCREDAYKNMMYCYGKLGQRSRALRWFALCQETLLRELDCPVSAATIDLQRRIRLGMNLDP